MNSILIFLALILAVLAALFLWLGRLRQSRAGLPRGRVIYADSGGWLKAEQSLYDPHSRLTGKPDYLVRDGDFIIPVEVKSSFAPPIPYETHIFQLAAYCLLVERTYGKRPSYGILHYRNRTIAVDYTHELEAELMDILDEMQRAEGKGELDRSHDEPKRCAGCGYRSICNQKL